MTLGEMDGVGKLYDLAQKIRTSPKALDDSRHLLPAGTGTPEVVSCRCISGRFAIFNDTNLGRGLRQFGSYRLADPVEISIVHIGCYPQRSNNRSTFDCRA